MDFGLCMAVCCFILWVLHLPLLCGVCTLLDCSHSGAEKSLFQERWPCQWYACHLAPSCQRTDCAIAIRKQEFGAAGCTCRAGKHMSPAWYLSFIWSHDVEINQWYSSNCKLFCLRVPTSGHVSAGFSAQGTWLSFSRLMTFPQRAQNHGVWQVSMTAPHFMFQLAPRSFHFLTLVEKRNACQHGLIMVKE